MKKKILATSIGLAFVLAASTASADFPAVVINSDIVLNYDQTIDVTGSVVIPTGIELGEADIAINQFNHDTPVSVIANVINNTPTGVDGQAITDLKVNATAVGNNASIELSELATIGSVQGNQNGGATATGNIIGNRIDLDTVVVDGEEVDGIVELNVTAVGNNLSIAAVEDVELDGVKLGSMQYNYDSPLTASGSIVRNGFGVDPTPIPNPPPVTPPPARDPKLAVTAVGNNLSSVLGTTGSMTQINRGSPIRATGLIAQNTGFIGPVSLDVTAVGNNISIKGVDLDD